MRLGSGWGGSPVVVNLPRIGSLVGWAAAGTESAGTARKPDASVPPHFLQHRIKLCQQRITNRRRRRYRPSPKNSATLSGISTFGAFFFITPPPKFSSSVPNHPESGFSPCPMEPADAPQSRDASHRYKKRVCLWTRAAWADRTRSTARRRAIVTSQPSFGHELRRLLPHQYLHSDMASAPNGV